MSVQRDRLQAISGSLRKGFALADRASDRQFQDLLHRLGKLSSPSSRNR